MSYAVNVNGANIQFPNVQELVFSTPANQSITIDLGGVGFVCRMSYDKEIVLDSRRLAGKGAVIQRITTGFYDIKINGKYYSTAQSNANFLLNSGIATDSDATIDLENKLSTFNNLFQDLKYANYLIVTNRVLNNIGIRNVVTFGNPSIEIMQGERAFSFSLSFKGYNTNINTFNN